MAIDPDFAAEFFLDIVDIYGPGQDVKNDQGMDEKTGLSLVASNVICMMDPKGESATASPIGRMDRDNSLTTDVFYFSDDAPPIEDGWFFQLKTPGHPEFGTWFSPIGGRQPWKIVGAVAIQSIRNLTPGMAP